ncbi:MAG: hypothetical protein Q9219_007374 [cf. Caloplaca sp. 3 TL-2023]
MSLRIFVQESPRVLLLASESHGLIFRYSQPDVATGFDKTSDKTNSHTATPKCLVEFITLAELNLSRYRLLKASGIHGTLGLINVATDIYLCVISAATKVATVRPDENVQKIVSVEFCWTKDCLNKADYNQQLHDDISQYPTSQFSATDNSYAYGSDSYESINDHPCFELRKLLSGGSFYYSVDFDLTNRLQDRLSVGSAFDIDSLDEDFLWNAYMIDPLIRFRSRLTQDEKLTLDKSRMLTSAIRGFVHTITIPAASSPLESLGSKYPSSLTVLSRLSCRRAGTRFNSRGIDDDGYVANFVETETVLWHPSELCFSYVQVRGSVPIFWEQATGLLPAQQKIQITRSPEATQSAFDKHFENLELTYGTVHILNLMSAMKPGEVELTTKYQQHIKQSPLNQTIGSGGAAENRLIQSQFDFHVETKGPGGYEAASVVRRLIQGRSDSFAYLLCDASKQSGRPKSITAKPDQLRSIIILQQEGVFRTNCLDCLDRTNLIQTIISQMALELFLRHRSERANADLWTRHSSLWADNGDVCSGSPKSWLSIDPLKALSRIYAGTGALKSSFTRHGKMSLAGAIADARKSATRMYINNFADKARQNTIDILLGRLVDQQPVCLYDPINDFVNAALQERLLEYSKHETIRIWTGTFNLNGKGHGIKEDLSAWLCPPVLNRRREPEIIAVGFQEIIELSPQQIMSTDPLPRQIWEEAVSATLNSKANRSSQDEYVLLRSGQLVGAALMVFVKSSSLMKIKNVEGSVKKTGMSGMAGNKGAVAIRMDYANTRICLVTAHLAAGFANYEERNRDYRTISHGLRFQRNRTIDDHDAVIWLGDMNYRIGLSDDKVRRLIKMNDLDSLYSNDQLNLQMIAGHVFPFYSEAPITFLPTSVDYCLLLTRNKARIPAWCDRILVKGNILKQIDYETAPLRFSDHRPVYATFECKVDSIDEKRKAELSRALYENRKEHVASTISENGKVDKDLISYGALGAGLLPASTDRQKWWLDNGLPARSQVRPPRQDMVLNPARPSNPFATTHQPDWITADRSQMAKALEKRIDVAPAPPHRHGTRVLSPLASDYAEGRFKALGKELSNGAPAPKTQIDLASPPVISNTKRKPAPPVPKKPALLSDFNIEQRTTAGKIYGESNQTFTNNIDTRNQKSTSRLESASSPTLQPSSLCGTDSGMTATKTGSAHGARKLPSVAGQINERHRPSSGSESYTTPPARYSGNSIGRRDLLDEDNEGAQKIPSLQPSRRI